jgi:hypothetical protein
MEVAALIIPTWATVPFNPSVMKRGIRALVLPPDMLYGRKE